MSLMEQISLSEQLGITREDAEFLQHILEEVGTPAQPEVGDATVDVTVGANSAAIDLSAVVADVNNDSLIQKIALEDKDSTSRFSSAIWYEKIQQQTVILAGLGGIGRFGNLEY